MHASDAPSRFPVKLAALWRQVFPIGVLVAAISAASRWLAGQPFSWPSTLPLAVAAAIVVAALHMIRPVEVDPRGIRLLHRLGFRRLVPWSSISEVRFGYRLPLEPGFRVTDNRGRVLWLPRHTMRLRELQRLSALYGGEDHPLALALETPLCDAP